MDQGLSTRLLIYKAASLSVGLVCIYLGYRLFMLGVYSEASLKASNGTISLTLDNAAPGCFFALFGSAIVAFTIFKGLSLEASSRENILPKQHETLPLALKSCGQRSSEILKQMKAANLLNEAAFNDYQIKFVVLYTSVINFAETGSVTREEPVISTDREIIFKGLGSAPS